MMFLDDLLAYYPRSTRIRDLPWRLNGTPLDLQVMVEGLLPRTRAEAVRDEWGRVFAGVDSAESWLGIPDDVRLARVEPLGLGRSKERLVTRLAFDLTASRADDLPPDFVWRAGYTNAMATLRWGLTAVAVDSAVKRVAERMGMVAERLVAYIVVQAVRREAGLPGPVSAPPLQPPSQYRAVCALLDVGALACVPVEPRCWACPINNSCKGAR